MRPASGQFAWCSTSSGVASFSTSATTCSSSASSASFSFDGITMRLSSFEKDVRREIEQWERGESSIWVQALNWAMKPLDWAVDRVAPPEVVDQAGKGIEEFLSFLNNASEWT